MKTSGHAFVEVFPWGVLYFYITPMHKRVLSLLVRSAGRPFLPSISMKLFSPQNPSSLKRLSWSTLVLAMQIGMLSSGVANAAPAKPVHGAAKVSQPASKTSDALAWIEKAKTGHFPPPIASTVARGKGVRVQDVFAAPGGLVGYVVMASSGEQRIYYVTPDGTTAIYGLAFDHKLINLTAQHLASYTNALSPSSGVGTLAPAQPQQQAAQLAHQPIAAQQVPQTQQATRVAQASNQIGALDQVLAPAWNLITQAQGGFVEGRGLDVYIVFDPACPFCHKTWSITRPLLDRLRIHWVPVAELGENSRRLAHSFIALPESSRPAAMAALVEKRFQADAQYTTQASSILASNGAILASASVKNVPLLMFMDRGRIQTMVGAPSPKQLQDLLTVAAANVR